VLSYPSFFLSTTRFCGEFLPRTLHFVTQLRDNNLISCPFTILRRFRFHSFSTRFWASLSPRLGAERCFQILFSPLFALRFAWPAQSSLGRIPPHFVVPAAKSLTSRLPVRFPKLLGLIVLPFQVPWFTSSVGQRLRFSPIYFVSEFSFVTNLPWHTSLRSLVCRIHQRELASHPTHRRPVPQKEFAVLAQYNAAFLLWPIPEKVISFLHLELLD